MPEPVAADNSLGAGPDSRVPAGAQTHPRVAAALPTLFDLIFLAVTSLVLSAAALPVLTGDGDLASHIRMGERILAEGGVPATYPFSFAMAGERFLGHAWLGEVVLAATHDAGGLAAILVLAGVLIGLCFAVLFRFLVARGVGVYVALGATALTAAGSVLHWLGRSHLFTWYFALLLLAFLERPPGRPRAPAWLLLPWFVVWTNLHGGFTYGILLIGLYLAGAKLDAGLPWLREGTGTGRLRGAFDAVRSAPPVRYFAACLGWAVAGSLVNPRGPWLYAEIATLLGDASIIDQINEFRSPDFHWGFATPFLLALLVTVVVLAVRRERLPTAWLLVLLANTYYALYSARNIPLFLLVAFPLVVIFAARGRAPASVGEGVGSDDVSATATGTGVATGTDVDFVRQKALQGPGWLSFAFALAVALLAVNHGRVGGAQLLPDGFSPDRFPVEAVREARTADLEGPLFNEMIWGGYVAYAWPERQSYIDGLLYDGDLLEEYRTIAMAQPGWREALERRGFRLALVPPDGTLAEHLVDEPGWALWSCDGTAAVVARGQGGVRGDVAHARLGTCRDEAEARKDRLPRLTE